jgi:hypothetical protein
MGVELKKIEESAIDTLEDGIRRVSGQTDFSIEALTKSTMPSSGPGGRGGCVIIYTSLSDARGVGMSRNHSLLNISIGFHFAKRMAFFEGELFNFVYHCSAWPSFARHY